MRTRETFRRARWSRRAPALALSAALLLAVIGGGGGGGTGGGPAWAQIPVTDVAHIAVNSSWHYAHYVQFALQIAQQYQQLLNQYTQIRAQLLALRKLANPQWREIALLLGELDRVVRSGRALGYALANVEAEFRFTYPGWRSWSDPLAYRAQTERALDTMRAGLAAVGRQTRDLAAGEQTLAAIRAQMGATAGHQEALEQLATLAGFQAQELLLARQSLAVGANLQAVGQAYWLNREAQARATFTLVATESALAGAQNGSQGWTFVPGGEGFFF